MKIEVDIEKLIKYKLTVDEYLLMECLYLGKKEEFWEYLDSLGIPLNWRGNNEFIKQEEEILTFDSIKLTDRFREVFHPPSPNIDVLWQEILETYPVKVPNGKGGFRRLHVDKGRALKYYKSYNISLEEHKKIIKCIEYEISERKKGMNLQFMYELPRYINEKGWEVYIEDVEKMGEQSILGVSNIEEGKTQLGGKF